MPEHPSDLARKLAAMEKKYDAQFKVVFDAIRNLMTPEPLPPKRQICTLFGSRGLLHGIPQELCGKVEFLYGRGDFVFPRREKLLDVAPAYPPDARGIRMEGNVMLEAEIGEARSFRIGHYTLAMLSSAKTI